MQTFVIIFYALGNFNVIANRHRVVESKRIYVSESGFSTVYLN
jgi:hypothetical protein